jgi:hypothetical protein
MDNTLRTARRSPRVGDPLAQARLAAMEVRQRAPFTPVALAPCIELFQPSNVAQENGATCEILVWADRGLSDPWESVRVTIFYFTILLSRPKLLQDIYWWNGEHDSPAHRLRHIT